MSLFQQPNQGEEGSWQWCNPSKGQVCDMTTIMVITEIQGNAIIFSYNVQR
jgi:hypothetical protein